MLHRHRPPTRLAARRACELRLQREAGRAWLDGVTGERIDELFVVNAVVPAIISPSRGK